MIKQIKNQIKIRSVEVLKVMRYMFKEDREFIFAILFVMVFTLMFPPTYISTIMYLMVVLVSLYASQLSLTRLNYFWYIGFLFEALVNVRLLILRMMIEGTGVAHLISVENRLIYREILLGHPYDVLFPAFQLISIALILYGFIYIPRIIDIKHRKYKHTYEETTKKTTIQN